MKNTQTGSESALQVQVACVEGSSPNGQPHSPPSPGAAATAATAQGGPGQHCTAALVQLVAWLVSQAAERRQTARTCAGLMQPEEDMLAQAWSAKLPMLRLRPGCVSCDLHKT